MTNEEAKQLAIKNAYGEYWEELKEYIDADGYIEDKRYPKHIYGKIKIEVARYELNNSLLRPISLRGIDTNNGWNRIDGTEASLPKIPGTYKVICKSDGDFTFSDFDPLAKFTSVDYFLEYYTHWKPVPEEPLPIY